MRGSENGSACIEKCFNKASRMMSVNPANAEFRIGGYSENLGLYSNYMTIGSFFGTNGSI